METAVPEQTRFGSSAPQPDEDQEYGHEVSCSQRFRGCCRLDMGATKQLSVTNSVTTRTSARHQRRRKSSLSRRGEGPLATITRCAPHLADVCAVQAGAHRENCLEERREQMIYVAVGDRFESRVMAGL